MREVQRVLQPFTGPQSADGAARVKITALTVAQIHVVRARADRRRRTDARVGIDLERVGIDLEIADALTTLVVALGLDATGHRMRAAGALARIRRIGATGVAHARRHVGRVVGNRRPAPISPVRRAPADEGDRRVRRGRERCVDDLITAVVADRIDAGHERRDAQRRKIDVGREDRLSRRGGMNRRDPARGRSAVSAEDHRRELLGFVAGGRWRDDVRRELEELHPSDVAVRIGHVGLHRERSCRGTDADVARVLEAARARAILTRERPLDGDARRTAVRRDGQRHRRRGSRSRRRRAVERAGDQGMRADRWIRPSHAVANRARLQRGIRLCRRGGRADELLGAAYHAVELHATDGLTIGLGHGRVQDGLSGRQYWPGVVDGQGHRRRPVLRDRDRHGRRRDRRASPIRGARRELIRARLRGDWRRPVESIRRVQLATDCLAVGEELYRDHIRRIGVRCIRLQADHRGHEDVAGGRRHPSHDRRPILARHAEVADGLRGRALVVDRPRENSVVADADTVGRRVVRRCRIGPGGDDRARVPVGDPELDDRHGAVRVGRERTDLDVRRGNVVRLRSRAEDLQRRRCVAVEDRDRQRGWRDLGRLIGGHRRAVAIGGERAGTGRRRGESERADRVAG